MTITPNRLLQVILLAIIPLALFFSSVSLRSLEGPYYRSDRFDPEYAYLLNSLNLINFRPPHHTDHPGTTAQVLGTVPILVQWAFDSHSTSTPDLTGAVLKNPEQYLNAINITWNILVALALWGAAIRFLRFSETFLAALLLETTLLFFLQVPLVLTHVSAEPVLILACLLLVFAVTPLLFASHSGHPGADSGRIPVTIGAVLGFGLATKITFVPLLCVILLLSTRRSRLIALTTCALAFLLFTLPILHAYPAMLNWFATILVHQGRYGSGAYGFPDFEALAVNLAKVYSHEPGFFIAFLFYLVAATGMSVTRAPGHNAPFLKIRRLLWVGCLVLALQIAATAKHPGAHYLIPSMIFTSLLNATSLAFLYRRVPAESKLLTLILATGLAGIVLTFSGMRLSNWMSSSETKGLETGALLDELKRDPACVPVAYYRSPSIAYALAFGNSYSGGWYGAALEQLYPGRVFYNIWKREFHTFTRRINEPALLEGLRSGHCVLLFGLTLAGDYEQYKGKLALVPLRTGSLWGLYRLTGIAQ